MTNRSLPSTKCIIPPLPNTLILPPATPWAAMALEAPMTGEDCANDPSHLLPGYKAVTLYSFLSLFPPSCGCKSTDMCSLRHFALRLNGHLRAALGSDSEESGQIANMPDFKPAALLQTCRTVYEEAFTIFHKSNVFYFEMADNWSPPGMSGASSRCPFGFRSHLRLSTNPMLHIQCTWTISLVTWIWEPTLPKMVGRGSCM